jgi:hypothetical protein
MGRSRAKRIEEELGQQQLQQQSFRRAAETCSCELRRAIFMVRVRFPKMKKPRQQVLKRGRYVERLNACLAHTRPAQRATTRGTHRSGAKTHTFDINNDHGSSQIILISEVGQGSFDSWLCQASWSYFSVRARGAIP